MDTNDNPTGKTLGCHGSKAEANKQVAALYANEGNMEKIYEIIDDLEAGLDILKGMIKREDPEGSTEDATDNTSEDIDKEEAEEDTTDVNIANDELEFNIDVIEKSAKKQITYSVVYEPDVVDTQGDFADAEEIEKMAHNYLKNHLVSIRPAADLQHQEELELDDAIPVESYIAPIDFEMGGQIIKKDSWVLALHIPNPQIWEMVEKGEITGYSLRGKGLRIPAQLE